MPVGLSDRNRSVSLTSCSRAGSVRSLLLRRHLKLIGALDDETALQLSATSLPDNATCVCGSSVISGLGKSSGAVTKNNNRLGMRALYSITLPTKKRLNKP